MSMKETITRYVALSIEKKTEQVMLEWPPECMGLFYEPEYPSVEKLLDESRL